MEGEDSATETVPLNTNGETLTLNIVDNDSNQKETDHEDRLYDENLIINLNEARQKKVVSGYMRYYYNTKINPYSIPIHIIFNYYNDIDDIYPGKYLMKHHYFTNSVHIDSNAITSEDLESWPQNLLLHHDALVTNKFRSMLSHLALESMLILLCVVLFAADKSELGMASMVMLIVALPCALISIFIFYKSYTRHYRLLKFNVDMRMIQEWIYIMQKMNHCHYACQLIAVRDICRFSDLNKISFSRPYIVRTRDSNGIRSKYYHDGSIRFITFWEKSISVKVAYHSEWIEMHEKIEKIMNKIHGDWFQNIAWDGFI